MAASTSPGSASRASPTAPRLKLQFADFPRDSTTLPSVTFVIPNPNHDMHNGKPAHSIPAADAWLRANLDGYYQWAKTHNSLPIVTFDENDDKEKYHGAYQSAGKPVADLSLSQRIRPASARSTRSESSPCWQVRTSSRVCMPKAKASPRSTCAPSKQCMGCQTRERSSPMLPEQASLTRQSSQMFSTRSLSHGNADHHFICRPQLEGEHDLVALAHGLILDATFDASSGAAKDPG